MTRAELIQVYGTTLKALIEEEFGDGIMSAIDFEMALERQADPKGDRVRLVSLKFVSLGMPGDRVMTRSPGAARSP